MVSSITLQQNFFSKSKKRLTVWHREKLQGCPKVQSGDFDLDGLCSDLQKKARCSGHGAVVDEKDFKNVMTKWLGAKDPNDSSVCGDPEKFISEITKSASPASKT
jgi:hypothetical protein